MRDADELKTIFQKSELSYPSGDMGHVVLKRIKAHNKMKKRQQFYLLLGKIGFGVTIVLFIFYAILVTGIEKESHFSGVYALTASAMILITIAIQLEFMPKSNNIKS